MPCTHNTDVREHTRMLHVLFTYNSRIFIPGQFFCKKWTDARTTYLSVLLLKIAILNIYNSISSWHSQTENLQEITVQMRQMLKYAYISQIGCAFTLSAISIRARFDSKT